MAYLHHYVDQGHANVDQSSVKHVGVDGTSSKRGHNYVSLFVDLEESRILFATEGKDAAMVERFQQDLVAHNGSPAAISEFCSDK